MRSRFWFFWRQDLFNFILAVILGAVLGFYLLAHFIAAAGMKGFSNLYHSFDWDVSATLIAAAFATISAGAAIKDNWYQKEKQQTDTLYTLAFESMEIFRRVQELVKKLEANDPSLRPDNLYVPMGWGGTNALLLIKPDKAVGIGQLRRLIKNYRAREYKDNGDRFKKDRKKLIRELNQFTEIWNRTFGPLEKIEAELAKAAG